MAMIPYIPEIEARRLGVLGKLGLLNDTLFQKRKKRRRKGEEKH